MGADTNHACNPPSFLARQHISIAHVSWQVGKGEALSKTVEALKAEKQAREEQMHKLQTE